MSGELGKPDGVLVKSMGGIRVLGFVMIVAAGALCQDAASVESSSQARRFPSAWQYGAKTQPNFAADLLPDAPVAQSLTPIDKFQVFVQDASSPLTFGAAGVNAAVMGSYQDHLAPPGTQSSFGALYGAAVAQRESNVFFSKYLFPSLLKQDPRYHPSTSDSFWGRAVYATSRLLITRNDAGKNTLNTSYFLGVLAAAAVSTAYRPYWARNGSVFVGNFGSTVGSDAGMNLFHEFWPGIRQKLQGHSPRFVQKLQNVPNHLTEGKSAQ